MQCIAKNTLNRKKFAAQCIFYWLIYDWKYDRAQGIHGSSGKMERQESDKGGYWHQAMRQMI